MRLHQTHSVDVRLGQKTRQKLNVEVRNELLIARITDEEFEEEDLLVEDDPPEPPQLEDLGDSCAHLESSPPGGMLDQAWFGELPLIKSLPKQFRPPVRYRIDTDLVVHAQYRPRSTHERLELAIAEAIAVHIAKNKVELESTGDWCKIPAIGSDEDLADLIPTQDADQLGADRLHSIGNALKGFAVELPNRDVVIPQVLIEGAKKGKVSTRGAALRVSSESTPERMPCGETWSKKDWRGFKETQKRASRRAREDPTQ